MMARQTFNHSLLRFLLLFLLIFLLFLLLLRFRARGGLRFLLFRWGFFVVCVLALSLLGLLLLRRLFRRGRRFFYVCRKFNLRFVECLFHDLLICPRYFSR